MTQIQDKSHNLGVYSSPQKKIEEGLGYLRIGFEEKNEAILMVTDELTKDEVRNSIVKKWKISPADETDLEKNGIINIKSPSEFYFESGIPDHDMIVKQYYNIVNKAIEKGKKGLRAFLDIRIFFERGYEKYIIEFEKSFLPLYDFPVIAICAYDLNDFEKLDHQSRKILFDHHNLHLKNNLFQNIFDDSSQLSLNEHICMYHEKKSQSSSVPITNSLLKYINEGLRQNQLCVYASIHNMKKDHPKTILSQISNLTDYQKEKNFIVVGKIDRYYISVISGDLKPFEDLKRQIFEKAILENKKEIRIVTDIPNLLFKNKHFDECVALEEWWNHTIEELNKKHGLNVSLLCTYHTNNFQNFPFKYHKYRINDNHSIVCNSEGIIHSKYFNSIITKRRGNKNARRQ